MKRHDAGSTVATRTTGSEDRADIRPGLDLVRARELLRSLLSEAGLWSYQVKPNATRDGWIVFAIQSTGKGAWQTFRIQVEQTRLREAHADLRARRQLVSHLANSLALRDAAG